MRARGWGCREVDEAKTAPVSARLTTRRPARDGREGDDAGSAAPACGGDAASVQTSSTAALPEKDGDGSPAASGSGSGGWRERGVEFVTHVLTRDPALRGKWVELPNGLGLKTTWNLLWTWSRPRINYDHLLTWQKVNHYPHAKHLTRKDFLARSIGRMRHLVAAGGGGRHAGFFDVVPETFVLPAEYSKLVAAHHAPLSALSGFCRQTTTEKVIAELRLDGREEEKLI